MSSKEQFKDALKRDKELLRSQSDLIAEQGKELVLRQRHINDLQMEIKKLKEKLNKKWWQFWKYKTF